MVAETASDTKKEIGDSINTAKKVAIADLHSEYDAILEDLTKFDKMKNTMEETKRQMQLECNNTNKLLEDARASNNSIRKELESTRKLRQELEMEIQKRQEDLTKMFGLCQKPS